MRHLSFVLRGKPKPADGSLPFAAFDDVEDLGENGLRTCQDIRIPEAENREAACPEPAVSSRVATTVPWLPMLTPIQFNDDPGPIGDEIHDVRTDRYLAAELDACDLAPAEGRP